MAASHDKSEAAVRGDAEGGAAAADGDEEEEDDENEDDSGDKAQPMTSGASGATPNRDAAAQDEYESKRRKRLELNRKAAQESRRRKKMRIEELQRSVVFLTRENNELREQNELLRQMLASEMPVEASASVDHFQAESTALKLALYESVQNLSRNKQGVMASGPMAASATNSTPMTANIPSPQINGVPLSAMPGTLQAGLPGALPSGIMGGPQGVPNVAGMMDALNAGRVAMPHMMGLTPAMMMARQQSAAAMLGMANAQQQIADASAQPRPVSLPPEAAPSAAAASTVVHQFKQFPQHRPMPQAPHQQAQTAATLDSLHSVGVSETGAGLCEAAVEQPRPASAGASGII